MMLKSIGRLSKALRKQLTKRPCAEIPRQADAAVVMGKGVFE